MSETERLYQRAGTGAVAFDEGLRKYMLGVYNYMAMGVAATALIAFFFLTNPAALQFAAGLRFLPFIGVLALGWLAPRMIFNGSKAVAHAAYWGYVALWGMLIGPFVAFMVGAGEALAVAQAFFISASIFLAMSLYGYTTKKDLSPWGKFLFMAGIGFLVLIVMNFFIQSTMFSFFISSGVILFISGVTAYETQMIKNLYAQGATEMNERAAIFGAFALYGSFVTLFIHVLNLLGIMRD
ncbi:Bax inhibitor-1/YccA family protein [Parvularcula lutaonensis]|uniref:Bax inhibitor-1 family protein n=1 Tax=Parvularcula lutaonensis TaxID=491923 RepID=A0ABV7MAE5_9PROT|nr:Bax inhibitor-1/YccA family protein [Parvularcula lutaonensis]GGY47701.1 membrane protein [Parvularcula lutaonensis]